ncbi:MAG: selenocysteine-specific translation elongation factor [Gemmatimonadetes bacterium]|nr:selenocysteine-specific translation elongation factor [Gemmatimonadota bacterium]
MRRLILGTAGHIDHGKTALVKALTGVDTDRLPDEKRRGITIDLGFAELEIGQAGHLGVVDVPGHEAFVRNMLAGVTGVDIVLLVVAADEGVMPQTREHLAIVEMLGVERAVIAVTKADLVDQEWLALVHEEIQEALAPTPYRDAPVIATSAVTGMGLDALKEALAAALATTRERAPDDLTRLPIDRVFTVHGTGTVVTGTLWTGTLRGDERIWILPDGPSARVRSLQVHGRSVAQAVAGERTAVALAGAGVGTETIRRGHVLVTSPAWTPSAMLTVRIALLRDTPWALKQRQRLRMHLGTAEIMARAVLLDRDQLESGEAAWAQLRLERPVVARARDRIVLRSYSPVTTIGGARIAEVNPPKRRRLDDEIQVRLETLLDGAPHEAVLAALALAGWRGVPEDAVAVLTGLSPASVQAVLAALEADAVRATGCLFFPGLAEAGTAQLVRAIHAFHDAEPLRPGMPLEDVRRQLPREAPPALAEELLSRLASRGDIEVRGTIAAQHGFSPRLTEDQQRAKGRLEAIYTQAALTPPAVHELPADLLARRDLWPLLKLLEEEGKIVPLADQIFASESAIREATALLRTRLGGRSGLGPTAFKTVFPISRKHLIPLLEYFDRTGITVRTGGEREVPALKPAGQTLAPPHG